MTGAPVMSGLSKLKLIFLPLTRLVIRVVRQNNEKKGISYNYSYLLVFCFFARLIGDSKLADCGNFSFDI